MPIPQSGKEISQRLIDVIENLYLENNVMRLILQENVPSLQQLLADAKSDPLARNRVRDKFAQLRDKVQHDHDLTEEFQALLQTLPTSDKVN